MSDDEKNPSQVSQEDRLSTLDKWFCDTLDSETKFLKQATEDEKFYLGEQWDSSDKRVLEQEGKPALVYNYVWSLANLINGYHRQNKLDLRVHPIRGGSAGVAEILTKLIKHIKQTKNGDWEIAYAHLMGLICGKSYLALNIDYDEDVANGQLYMEFLSCFDVLVDPYGSRYDLADRDFYFKSVWMPKAKIKRVFPGKIKDGDFIVNNADRKTVYGEETDNYKDGAKFQEDEDDNKQEYRYRVKECWWKEYDEQKYLVNVATGAVTNVTELKQEELKRIKSLRPEFREIRRVKPTMHMAQYVGNVLLSYQENPMGKMMNFPIVGFFPYFMRTTCQGIITQLKDPQREHNKRMSQALHHLNQSANSGYTADEDAVDDWDELERNLSKAGYIKKIKPGKRFEKDNPTELSQGHIMLANIGAQAIKLISGVNSDMLGQDTSETVSGVAIARRQAQGLMTTEIVHDNMKLSLKTLGDRMIEAIQKSGAYSKQEILRLVVDDTDEEIVINKKIGDTMKVLNDLTIGSYETTVTVAIQTPTVRVANYMAMLEAVKLGIPIPPEIIVDMSDWPNKEKIIQGMQAMKQAQMEAKQMEMQDKEKDRQLKIQQIQTKQGGDLLRDAQKAQLELLTQDKERMKKQKSLK